MLTVGYNLIAFKFCEHSLTLPAHLRVCMTLVHYASLKIPCRFSKRSY